jgi:hypothetical protein
VGAARVHLLSWLRLWLIECASVDPAHGKLTAETVLLECWHDDERASASLGLFPRKLA